TIYWDKEAGRPHAYHEQFSILFQMSNGDEYEFIGTARAKITESDPMDKEKVVEELNRIFDEDDVADTKARVDETGVTIDLEDIKFEADSDRLLDSEKKKLDRIAEVLAEYPDRHLEITGHTALAGSEEGRQRLSELRAQSVAEYLLEKGIREPKEIITEGKGAREPVADNSTEEGMRRNRRVEITILEN
ncbi:MAG: OmpA family protein, partial [Spirochaetia bacterium]